MSTGHLLPTTKKKKAVISLRESPVIWLNGLARDLRDQSLLKPCISCLYLASLKLEDIILEQLEHAGSSNSLRQHSQHSKKSAQGNRQIRTVTTHQRQTRKRVDPHPIPLFRLAMNWCISSDDLDIKYVRKSSPNTSTCPALTKKPPPFDIKKGRGNAIVDKHACTSQAFFDSFRPWSALTKPATTVVTGSFNSECS